MQPDMIISWDQHLKHGNVWQVEVELAMQGGAVRWSLSVLLRIPLQPPTPVDVAFQSPLAGTGCGTALRDGLT